METLFHVFVAIIVLFCGWKVYSIEDKMIELVQTNCTMPVYRDYLGFQRKKLKLTLIALGVFGLMVLQLLLSS